MAIVTRYFSTSAAGTGDATSWANRAALFTGGVFSSVLTSFGFTGTDSLIAYVGPGTYTITAQLTIASILVANPLTFNGCDSSGNPLTPSSPSWTSDLPSWDDSSLPVFSLTSNLPFATLANTFYRLIKFTSSTRTSGALLANTGGVDWCSFVNSSSGTSVVGYTSAGYSRITNCIFMTTGAAYASVIQISDSDLMSNCRLVGVIGTSGTRDGVSYVGSSAAADVIGNTIAFHGGRGVVSNSSVVGQKLNVFRNTIVANGGDGVQFSNTVLQTAQSSVIQNLIVDNSGWAVNAQGQARVFVSRNRFRNNTLGTTTGTSNYQAFDNNVSTTTDAAEFVGYATGNYQVSRSAVTAGQGFGVSQQGAMIISPTIVV